MLLKIFSHPRPHIYTHIDKQSFLNKTFFLKLTMALIMWMSDHLHRGSAFVRLLWVFVFWLTGKAMPLGLPVVIVMCTMNFVDAAASFF